MAVYTKTGDKGNTKVFDKKTGQLVGVKKDSCHIRTIGAIDELNSFLGVVSSFSQNIKLMNHSGSQASLIKIINNIQGNLFTINSILAGSKLRFSKTKITKLEKQIDVWEGTLPVQKNFIFYGGSKESSLIFYTRALARRAERSLVSFSKSQYTNPDILVYVNRLSDYLFMLGRSVNFENKVKEKFWKTSK